MSTTTNNQDDNNKLKSSEQIKELEKTNAPDIPKVQNSPEHQQKAQSQAIPQQINLNDIVMDLKVMSDMANTKVLEYSDLTATFKQIGQVSNNLALALSTHLKQIGELDESRFKLTPT